MTLVFRSDSSIAREGFSANYVALDGSQVCGGVYHSTIGSKFLFRFSAFVYFFQLFVFFFHSGPENLKKNLGKKTRENK